MSSVASTSSSSSAMSAASSVIPQEVKPVLIIVLAIISFGGAGLSGWVFVSAIREKHSIVEELGEIV